ncbi:unnamed protein product [Caenorhabditis auriculariae]|uniref:THAP-type domain-containing protein n=1 Tax=Caenorhabditis auriculariae TaxID=2777116 RepID=A0A8S1H4E5_9PELO|nr:unnamed protein product [Caenorhabditis auriculariae]
MHAHYTRSKSPVKKKKIGRPAKYSKSTQEAVVPTEPTKKAKPQPIEPEPEKEKEVIVDVVGPDSPEEDVPVDTENFVLPSTTSSGEELTPRKETAEEHAETVYSSFPSHIIPETLSRVTRTPTVGENLLVQRMRNGRLRVQVKDSNTKHSVYCAMSHLRCFVCSRRMEAGEMHLNFPADLDRRRIWANLLGFKYKDILRVKTSIAANPSVSAGPICCDHFTEECFRTYNFNKAAIEAFGVPAAISPDVKTTPSKKRVPWVCTICGDYSSCSVVDLQKHLLEHVAEFVKKGVEVPPSGFMCPFCRQCTYGYRTVSGFRRHLIAPPVMHCHLKRIFEFAKMNCRSAELEPKDSWENWTQRNVYIAYHGCEPPANEIIATPTPVKSPIKFHPKPKDQEKKRKAVRALGFDDVDVERLQRAVRSQIKKDVVAEKPKTGVVPEKKEIVKKASPERIAEPEKAPVTPKKSPKKPATPKKKKALKKRGKRSRSLDKPKNVQKVSEGSKTDTERAESSADSSVFSSPTKEPPRDPKEIEAALKMMVSSRSAAFRKMMSSRLPIVTRKRREIIPKPVKTSKASSVSSDTAEASTNVPEITSKQDDKPGSSQQPEKSAESSQETVSSSSGTTEASSSQSGQEEPERKPKSLIAQAVAAGKEPPLGSYRLTREIPPQEPSSSTEDREPSPKKMRLDEALMTSSADTPVIRPVAIPADPPRIVTEDSTNIAPRLISARAKPSVLLSSSMRQRPIPSLFRMNARKDADVQATTRVKPMTLVDALASAKTSTTSTVGDAVDQPLFLQGPLVQYTARRQIKMIRTDRKTARQLEAIEARIRLFGDTSEIPEGYQIIDTPMGSRLVEIDEGNVRF